MPDVYLFQGAGSQVLAIGRPCDSAHPVTMGVIGKDRPSQSSIPDMYPCILIAAARRSNPLSIRGPGNTVNHSCMPSVTGNFLSVAHIPYLDGFVQASRGDLPPIG